MALIQRLHPTSMEIQKTASIKWKLIKMKTQFGHTEDYIEFDDVINRYVDAYNNNTHYASLTLAEFLDKVNL